MPTPKELGVQVGDTIRIAGPRTGPQGKPRRVESVGNNTLHTSCGVTVSLNSPGWEMVRRQPRGPEAIPHEPLPQLEDWAEIEGAGGEVRIHGKVFGSAKFPDGTLVTTSRLKYASRGLVKEGVTVETQNTTYLLGKHGGHIPRAPEAPAVVPEITMTPGTWVQGADPTPFKHHIALRKAGCLPQIPRLEDWAVTFVEQGNAVGLKGVVYGDPNTPDGSLITSGRLNPTPASDLKAGAIVDAESRSYVLGMPHKGDLVPYPIDPSDPPKPLPSCRCAIRLEQGETEAPEPEVALEWNDHDAGPDKVILDVLGKVFLHVEKGGLYRVGLGAMWDSGRDRWLIQYSRRRNLYVHLPEDFLRPGRFIEVED